MIRIIVADDHNLVRAGIVGMLKQRDDMEVVAETGSSAEAMELCKEHKPHILLLDLNMPGIDGLEVATRLRRDMPGLKIIILTMHESEDYALRLLKAGASGFLVKGIEPEELPRAVLSVAGGDIFVTESIMKRITLRQAKGDADIANPLGKLSDRELQVFIRFARGMSANDVADELCLSVSTVGTYKSRIMEKLNLNNNMELVRLALKFGFADNY